MAWIMKVQATLHLPWIGWDIDCEGRCQGSIRYAMPSLHGKRYRHSK